MARPAEQHHDGGSEAPECEPLAELLQVIDAADRANARAVGLLTRLHATGEAEAATGVAVETWLLSRGVPASDRRMLATAATQLSRLPPVADGFARGVVSWGQVRTICLLTDRLSADDATEFDLTLAASIDRYADAAPDGLLQIARQIVDRLRPDHTISEVERVERERFISMQPRLDGTGGRFHGDLDGLGFGLVAASLDTGAPLPARRRDHIGRWRTPPHGGARRDRAGPRKRAHPAVGHDPRRRQAAARPPRRTATDRLTGLTARTHGRRGPPAPHRTTAAVTHRSGSPAERHARPQPSEVTAPGSRGPGDPPTTVASDGSGRTEGADRGSHEREPSHLTVPDRPHPPADPARRGGADGRGRDSTDPLHLGQPAPTAAGRGPAQRP